MNLSPAHSWLQVPDFVNARIGGVPATDLIRDMKWFREEFTPKVSQGEGAGIRREGGPGGSVCCAPQRQCIGQVWSTLVDKQSDEYMLRHQLVWWLMRCLLCHAD